MQLDKPVFGSMTDALMSPSASAQNILRNALLVWSLKNPKLSYRQGASYQRASGQRMAGRCLACILCSASELRRKSSTRRACEVFHCVRGKRGKLTKSNCGSNTIGCAWTRVVAAVRRYCVRSWPRCLQSSSGVVSSAPLPSRRSSIRGTIKLPPLPGMHELASVLFLVLFKDACPRKDPSALVRPCATATPPICSARNVVDGHTQQWQPQVVFCVPRHGRRRVCPRTTTSTPTDPPRTPDSSSPTCSRSSLR